MYNFEKRKKAFNRSKALIISIFEVNERTAASMIMKHIFLIFCTTASYVDLYFYYRIFKHKITIY